MKQKLTLLLIALLCTMGAWAETGTITVKGASDSSFGDNGTFSKCRTTWATMWQSNSTPCLTITSTKNSRYMSGSIIATSDYAMFLPLGYKITGYTISFKSNAAGNSKITGYGAKKADKGSATSTGTTDEQTLTVSGISTQSVEFKVETTHANVTTFTVSYETTDDVMPFVQGGYYRLKEYSGWVTDWYLYAYRSDSNTDRLKKGSANANKVLTHSNYIWKASSVSGSQVQFQNELYGYYMAKLPTTAAQVAASITSSSDDAETFNVIDRSAWGTGYFSLLAQSPITTAMTVDQGDDITYPFHFYDGCSSSDSLMNGLNYEHQGGVLSTIRVKKVTFSSPVAVNGNSAVSTIYIATDGSESITLPANYKYTIGGVEMNGLQAATAIAAAGTSDMTVTVSSPILVNDQKYRIQQAWSASRFYLYANTSDASNGNRLWKNSASLTTLLTNANFIWQAKSSSDKWKLFNSAADNGAGRYIAKATNTSADGTGVNALNASSADDAEVFTLVSAESSTNPSDYSTSCYVALKSNTKETYLNTYSTYNYYVGWHNAAHAGYYFSFIPVKTVNFIDGEDAAFAVAVNGESVSTIYVATDGSDTFTLPSSYLYSINGADAVINTEAAEAIAEAGTTDITVTVSDNPSRNVTYKLMWKSTEVTSVEDVTTYVSAPASEFLPSTFIRDYVEFSYSPSEITSNTEEVTVTASWTGPFEIFDDFDDIDHWYDMSVRSTWYVTSDQTDGDGALSTVNANALGLATDPYQWAFVGNPYSLKLYNKDKGEDYVYAWTASADKNIPTFVTAATGNTWTIKASTASGYTNAFMLTIPESGYQVNQHGGEGGSLKIWNDTRTTDAGSAFKVFDVPDDFAEYVVSEIAPYMESEATVFNWTSAARTAIGYDAAYKSSCTFDEYKTMKEALLDKLADQSSFTLPESGKYYTVKNIGTNKYLYIEGKNSGNGSIYDVKTSATMKPACVVKVSTINSHPYFLSQGLQYSWASASPNASTGNARAESTGKYAHYYVTKPGQGAIAFVLGNGENLGGEGDYTSYTANSYYRDNGSGVVIGGTYDDNSAQWVMEEITSVSIPMNYVESENYSYGTMYLPYDVTVPAYGQTGFVIPSLVTVESSRARLNTSMKTQIPANIPVLLAAPGELTSTTATFATSALNDPISGDNDLGGTFFDKTSLEENEYVFGTSNGELGFWKLDTANGKKVGANKAYLVVPGGSGVKGYALSFDDIEDGIKTLSDSPLKDENIYNLAGQRISKMQKGINIVNGKKVIIK